MDSLINYLKEGKAADAAALIEKALNKKVKSALTEERQAVMAETYNQDSDEEVED
jgi:Tfp pilus assembly protein PilF